MHRLSESGSKKKPLFTIDIKISGQMVSVPVFDGQNHQSLIKRFCQQHLLKSDYQQAVKNRIIEALLATIKRAQISTALKQKVNNFLNQNQPSSHVKLSKNKQAKKISNTQTPFNLLLSQSHSSHKKNSSNRHIGGHINPNQSQQKSLNDVQISKISKPVQIKKNKTEKLQKAIIDRIGNQSKYKPSGNKPADSDLISAYETIYRKSKQPHMKNMAKKFLQQCGYFNKQQNSNSKITRKQPHESSQLFNNIQIKNPHISSNTPNQVSNFPSHSKNKQKITVTNNNSINNLSHRTQSFQLSKQASKLNDYSIKESPKKLIHQGSYIRQAHLKFEDRYNKQVPEYGNYSNQYYMSPYKIQRNSISYQRLPHNHPDIIYDDRSSFRYLGPQIQKSVSLRKTRKYKYL